MGELSGLGAALIFAISNILVRSQSERIDMLSLNALRLLAATPIALLAPLLFATGSGAAQPSLWSWVCVLLGGIISMGIGDTVYYRSQNLLGVLRAQPIANIYPVFTMLLAATFLGERPTWTLGVAIGLVMAGIYLLADSGDAQEVHVVVAEGRSLYIGVAMAVFAGLCWAISTTLFRQSLLEMDFTIANQVRVPVATIFLLGTLQFARRPIVLRRYSRRTLVLIAFVGVLGMGIGSLLFLYSVQTAGATKTALLTSLSPLFGAPLTAIFLGERITMRRALGMVFCLSGVWLILVPLG